MADDLIAAFEQVFGPRPTTRPPYVEPVEPRDHDLDPDPTGEEADLAALRQYGA